MTVFSAAIGNRSWAHRLVLSDTDIKILLYLYSLLYYSDNLPTLCFWQRTICFTCSETQLSRETYPLLLLCISSSSETYTSFLQLLAFYSTNSLDAFSFLRIHVSSLYFLARFSYQNILIPSPNWSTNNNYYMYRIIQPLKLHSWKATT